MVMNPYNLDLSTAKVLRQSTLGTADTCHKRLEYQLDPSIPYGTGEARIVGTAYHAGLERYYLDRRDAEFADTTVEIPAAVPLGVLFAAEEAFKREVLAAPPDLTWETSEEQAWDRVQQLLTRAFPDLIWPLDFLVVAVEQEIWAPIPDTPGWVMKGTLDLILRSPDSGHVLVDHKTAAKKWKAGKESFKNTNQAAWYTLFWPMVWKAATGEDLTSVRFVFDINYDGGVERREALDATHTHDLVLAKAQGVARLIDQDGPFLPNTSSFLCDARWCDFWERCPFGAHRADVAVHIRR